MGKLDPSYEKLRKAEIYRVLEYKMKKLDANKLGNLNSKEYLYHIEISNELGLFSDKSFLLFGNALTPSAFLTMCVFLY